MTAVTISDRVAGAKPSLTKAFTQKARELASAGVDVITLSQGELDFDTPAHIAAAGIAAIQEGKTRYTEVPGVLPLREAIAAKLARDNGLSYPPDQITVGVGAKQLLFNGLFAMLNPGDEVVFPVPCWVSYPEMVSLVGGVPVAIPTFEADRWVLTPDNLRSALTDRTRVLMLNSPSNPTGSVYSVTEFEALAAVLRERPDIWILSDDIYEPLTYGGAAFASIATIAPDLRDRILVVNGVSKSAAMTGWRLGYAAGPKALVAAMNLLQSQSASHATSISQYAAIEALAGNQSYVAKFREAMERRRQLVCDRLAAIEGIGFSEPQGAFYIYLNVEGLIGAETPEGRLLETDTDVAMYWLAEGVAGVPGTGFMTSPYVRLSFASDEESLVRACDRLADATAKLRRPLKSCA